MQNKDNFLKNYLIDLTLIAASAIIFIASLFLLGFSGTGVGLDVSPMGEDLNWLDMLQRGEGSAAARLFWAIDSRNPLSPWWYIAARDIILRFDWGLLALRYTIATILAFSVYAMVLAVAGRETRSFALGTALAVLFWMANRYTEQIYWNFQGALAATLFCVATYASSLEGSRSARSLQAYSLVAWIIAISTYTIQFGAVFAVGYIAVRRLPSITKGNKLLNAFSKIRLITSETLPYLVIFAIFILIWWTTIIPSSIRTFEMDFKFSRLLASIGEGFWSSDIGMFWAWLMLSSDRIFFVFAASLIGMMIFFVIMIHGRSILVAQSILDSHPSFVPYTRLFDVMIVIACAVGPTIIIESGSGPWEPGTRWPMVYQLSAPIVILFIPLALIVLFVSLRVWQIRLWAITVGVTVGIGSVFSFAHNRVQNDITRFERFVRESITFFATQDLLLGGNQPLQFLLMMHHTQPWRSSDIMSPTLSRVWFRGSEISFRIIPSYPNDQPQALPWWSVRFGADSEGVISPKEWGGNVPYSRIRVLRFDNNGVQMLSQLRREDLLGWQAEWNRDRDVELPIIDPRMLCPLRWVAEQNLIGLGWSVAERDAAGDSFRWTNSTAATLMLPNVCSRPKLLRIVTASALSMRNVAKLAVYLNGTRLDATRRTVHNGSEYIAEIPSALSLEGRLLNVSLRVETLDTIAGVDRRFGVAVRSVELLP